VPTYKEACPGMRMRPTQIAFACCLHHTDDIHLCVPTMSDSSSADLQKRFTHITSDSSSADLQDGLRCRSVVEDPDVGERSTQHPKGFAEKVFGAEVT
jgi:hypothetical protein